jgi:TPR repeat protein
MPDAKMQGDHTRRDGLQKQSNPTAAPPPPIVPGLAPGGWAAASFLVRGGRPCMHGSSPRKTKPAASCRKAGRRALFISMFLCCFAAGLPTARAERRVAMVIGNAAYQNVPPLKTPTTDADEVSKLLRTLDFNVIELTDVDKVGLERALRQFSAEMDRADVALFYYSGHGVQIGDINYLVPISAKIDGARSLALDTIALQDVNSAMQEAGVKVELLFLDACRDNPFASAFASAGAKGATRGFAPVRTTTGSLVAFSTAPGQAAQDGTGDVSPFTRGFLRYAAVPGLDIRQVLTRVRSYVTQETNNQQVPWDSSSLLGDFYLVPKRAAPLFEKFSSVELASDATVQSLRLAAPTQPEGGPVTVKIQQRPASGRLTVDSRQIKDGEVLSSADFARLTYQSTTSPQADTFSFTVSDAWGNTELGLVRIAFGSNVAPAPISKPHEHPPVDIDTSAIALIGVGPNLVFRKGLPSPTQNERAYIQLASDLPFGQLSLGKRVIEKGRSIALSDLTQLAFLPPVGSEDKHLDALFSMADGSEGKVKLGIDVKMSDCDRLAGAPRDLQGVAKGVPSVHINTVEALPACQLALKIQPNSGRFNFQLARVHDALGHNDEAVTFYRKALDLGHFRAGSALGYRYLNVPPTDPPQGVALLGHAAAAGDVAAIYSLGTSYFEGRGVTKDVERGRSLFETAARIGEPSAMNALGVMFLRGESVPADPALARRYFEEAAARGDVYGIANLGRVYLNGIDAVKDPARALTYFEKASELGHPGMPNEIGRLYLLGIGVPVDYSEALRWYTIGADRGDSAAALNLGELMVQGRGGPKDEARAAYYYARAAASNRNQSTEKARKALNAMSGNNKTEALRLLLGDIDPANRSAPDAALADLARRAIAKKNLKPTDDSPDALLIAVAQARWLSSNMRADLF